MTMNWQLKSFKELTLDELYDVIKLRIDVFVVEQACYYSDLDELDRHKDTRHLFCYQDGKIAAYLRILAKQQTYADYPSIGRVIIAPFARKSGLGHEMVNEALIACRSHFPNQAIKISAQEHLEKFYNKHQFLRVSDTYLEDGIPHIGMIKKAD